ncbi:hypothetical protein NKI54_35010 [Mesorhizobium sp. M0663]|uniref:hypothetical protein n=1 Tax=Mesorhizobium sp. M0663 TaxID=2956981 RepID=UPI00333D9805
MNNSKRRGLVSSSKSAVVTGGHGVFGMLARLVSDECGCSTGAVLDIFSGRGSS